MMQRMEVYSSEHALKWKSWKFLWEIPWSSIILFLFSQEDLEQDWENLNVMVFLLRQCEVSWPHDCNLCQWMSRKEKHALDTDVFCWCGWLRGGLHRQVIELCILLSGVLNPAINTPGIWWISCYWTLFIVSLETNLCSNCDWLWWSLTHRKTHWNHAANASRVHLFLRHLSFVLCLTFPLLTPTVSYSLSLKRIIQ